MRQLFVIIFSGIISAISLGVIVFSFDPFLATGYVKVLFYVSLFATTWSIGTILFFYLKPESEDRFESAFRWGLFLSIAILAIFLGLRFK